MKIPMPHTRPCRRTLLAFTSLCLFSAAGPLSAIDKPSLIGDVSTYGNASRNTGIVYKVVDSTIHMGSGYAVNERTIVTAAHVIFDTDTLSWETGYSFDRAFNMQLGYVSGVATAGSMHMESFSTAMTAYKATSDYQDGYEDGPTFNSDIAALYTLNNVSNYNGNYTISHTGEPSVAAEEWKALLLGYPSESTYISDADAGKMFATGPGNWGMDDVYGTNNGDASVGSTHAALFSCTNQMTSYAGNSGGPLFVYDEDDGDYTQLGIYLGGGTVESYPFSYFRIIDDTAESVIEQAIAASGSSYDLSPAAPTASASGNSITLAWTDKAKGESGWQIRRNDGARWNIVATVQANSTSYVDTSAEKGITYQYEIRSVRDYGNGLGKGPWSKRTTATISGASSSLAAGINAPYLYVNSSGDAPFYAASDNSYVRSGKILNNQTSAMTITVTGPGTFTYNVATSTEGAAYDVVKVALDGSAITSIGGVNDYSKKTISVSKSGSHTISFTYSKDNYSTGGDDCIYLKNVAYYCSSASEAVQGGKVTSGQWRYSTWMGHYYDYGNDWVYSFNLGYMYVFAVTQTVWNSDEAQWYYFDQGTSAYEKLGWCWVGAKTLPWIWSSNLGWVYYYEGGSWMQIGSSGNYIKLQ
jgi:hypothetical protein